MGLLGADDGWLYGVGTHNVLVLTSFLCSKVFSINGIIGAAVENLFLYLSVLFLTIFLILLAPFLGDMLIIIAFFQIIKFLR